MTEALLICQSCGASEGEARGMLCNLEGCPLERAMRARMPSYGSEDSNDHAPWFIRGLVMGAILMSIVIAIFSWIF